MRRPCGQPPGGPSLTPARAAACSFRTLCMGPEVATKATTSSRGPLREGRDSMVPGSTRRPRGDPTLARGQLGHSAEDPTARESLIAVAQHAGAKLRVSLRHSGSDGGCVRARCNLNEGGRFQVQSWGRPVPGGASTALPSVVGALPDWKTTQATGRSGQVGYSAGPRSREMRATSQLARAMSLPTSQVSFRCPNFRSDSRMTLHHH
jgi:hypothetical protein